MVTRLSGIAVQLIWTPFCPVCRSRPGDVPTTTAAAPLDYNQGIFRVARTPFHIHHRPAGSQSSLGRSPALSLRIITASRGVGDFNAENRDSGDPALPRAHAHMGCLCRTLRELKKAPASLYRGFK